MGNSDVIGFKLVVHRTLSGTMIKMHFPFSSVLKSRSAECLPCQMLSSNSKGKSSYFKRKSSASACRHYSIKNSRDPHRELDLVWSSGSCHSQHNKWPPRCVEKLISHKQHLGPALHRICFCKHSRTNLLVIFLKHGGRNILKKPKFLYTSRLPASSVRAQRAKQLKMDTFFSRYQGKLKR